MKSRMVNLLERGKAALNVVPVYSLQSIRTGTHVVSAVTQNLKRNNIYTHRGP